MKSTHKTFIWKQMVSGVCVRGAGGGGEEGRKRLCLVHPWQFYLSSVILNCRLVVFILNEISSYSFQITVPGTKLSVPTQRGRPGQWLQPSVRFQPKDSSPGARHNWTTGCHQSSRNVNSKNSKHFFIWAFPFDAKKWGKKITMAMNEKLLNLQGHWKC